MRRQRRSKYKSRFYRYDKRSRLKGIWTMEPIQDLVCLHFIDLEAELSKWLIEEVLGTTNEKEI